MTAANSGASQTQTRIEFLRIKFAIFAIIVMIYPSCGTRTRVEKLGTLFNKADFHLFQFDLGELKGREKNKRREKKKYAYKIIALFKFERETLIEKEILYGIT